MKNNIALLILLIAFLLVACNERQSNNRQLILADSLMQSRPDSALCILQGISMEKFATQADSAYYALLLTQARDKNYVVQTDDSLIRYAVAYFDKVNDVYMQAKAHYYWGCVWRDKGEHLKAIDEYHTSHSFAKKVKNMELSALIYSNVAYLYYIQGLNIEADSVYQLAEQLAIQQKDTTSLVYTLSQQGMINLEKGKYYYPKAEQHMQQALLLAELFSDTTVKTPVYESLSTLYCEMEEVEKALQYAKLNYYSQRDTQHRCRASLLLGDAYFKCEQYDSAEVYLRKVFTEDRYYITKADACMRLAEIAEIHGDMDSVAMMRNEQISYTDSAQQELQNYDILQSIISQERKNNEHTQRLYIYSTIIFVLFLLCTGGFVTLKYIKRSRKQQINEEIQKQKLQIELNSLTSKRQALIKEEYESSVVYIKLKNIARILAKVETNENLNEVEWQQLIVMTDEKWNGILIYLNITYSLSAEDIQICCLYLAGIPVKYIGHFIKGYARSTIQLKARDIIQKIGAPKGCLLKNVLFSLSDELKSKRQSTV